MGMTQTIAILGRQPALGLAELESLFGDTNIKPVGRGTAILDVPPEHFPIQRLGGTMKAAKLLVELPFTDWQKIENHLAKELPHHASLLPEGKIRLGLSTYGLNPPIKRLNNTGLTLKKAIKTSGRSVRVVPNNATKLNTAQILHNQLTGPTGIDLLLIQNGSKTLLAQTFAVQDIEAYAARDQARPKRDARVGMLPPKLAQIIVNLAVGHIESPVTSHQSRETSDKRHETVSPYTVLDPFCGTGVVLQEALLMGYHVIGSDIEQRMILYTSQNLEWLTQRREYPAVTEEYIKELSTVDATIADWEGLADAIACETYLGQPFSAEPDPEKLKQVMQDVDTIHRKFLQNVARQTKPGFRMCIAVPAWKTKNGFKHLKMLDSLEELGYNRVSFAHVSTRDLIYHRDNQVVGRELVTLIRK